MTSVSRYYFVGSEYKSLKAVLLYKPGKEIEEINDPLNVLHIRKIDYKVIEEEYDQIIKLYKRLKIKVYLINPGKIDDNDRLFNIMYVRDLFFMTPEGAIMSKMASELRQDEVKYAEKAIRSINIPIKKIIENSGTFEGADALWVNDKLVVVGVGNRTNVAGFLQVRDELKSQDIDCISVSAPGGTQHLLGILQFVDSNLALVRVDLADLEIIDFLRRNKIKIVNIPENDEIKEKQAMNIVTIAPREIIMPTDCPKTKKIYQNYGIKIAAEIKINQLINGGGGLACATAIIARQL